MLWGSAGGYTPPGYRVEKAFRGSALSPAPEEEWLDFGANLEENFEVMEAHLCQIQG